MMMKFIWILMRRFGLKGRKRKESRKWEKETKETRRWRMEKKEKKLAYFLSSSPWSCLVLNSLAVLSTWDVDDVWEMRFQPARRLAINFISLARPLRFLNHKSVDYFLINSQTQMRFWRKIKKRKEFHKIPKAKRNNIEKKCSVIDSYKSSRSRCKTNKVSSTEKRRKNEDSSRAWAGHSHSKREQGEPKFVERGISI